MAENLNNNLPNARKEDEFNLTDMLTVALNYWRWYVASIIICLICAFIYVKRSPDVYQRQATVMIKSQKGSGQLESEAAAFEDLGIVSTSKSVDNELLVFQTKRLMRESVRRLHLDVDYSREGRFREFTLYGMTPVKLFFPDAEETDKFQFIMTPNKDKTVSLHDFVHDGKRISKEVIAKAGTTVNTPIGRVLVEENSDPLKKDLTNVDIIVRKYDLKKTSLSYSSRLQTALANKMASIISLTIQDVSKERAEDVINTLIDVYNEDAINDKNKVVVNTDTFINNRLEALENELGSVDMTIANFKSSNQLTDIKADVSAFRSSYSAIEQQAADLHNQKSVAQYILSYIQGLVNENRYDVIPNNVGIQNSQVETLISQYNTLTLQREKLMRDAGASNPQVEDLANNIEQLRVRIISSIHNLVKSLDIEIANISGRVDQGSNRLTAVPSQQKTVTSIERQQRIKENLYMYLLNKREANNLKKNMTEDNARVLDPAEGSDNPVAPRKAMIMLLGLILGLAIPSAILWFSVIGSTKVRGRKDIQKALSIPFAGEVPEAEEEGKFPFITKIRNFFNQKQNRRRHHLDVIVSKDSKDPVSEAVRILRTNLNMLTAGDKSKKVFMMTSYIPSAGKTFVTSNLGMSLALTGKKVILVDLDIRRASLSAQFGHNLPGVTNYLGGYADNIDDLIIHTKYNENLDVLPAGISAPNPAELLLLPALDKLFEELKTRYDYIIIDSVPAQVVADGVIVNRVADLTLFVVRAGNLDRRLLPDIQQLHDEERFKNMCVVLNGVSKAHLYTSYYGYKYSGYGY